MQALPINYIDQETPSDNGLVQVRFGWVRLKKRFHVVMTFPYAKQSHLEAVALKSKREAEQRAWALLFYVSARYQVEDPNPDQLSKIVAAFSELKKLPPYQPKPNSVVTVGYDGEASVYKTPVQGGRALLELFDAPFFDIGVDPGDEHVFMAGDQTMLVLKPDHAEVDKAPIPETAVLPAITRWVLATRSLKKH